MNSRRREWQGLAWADSRSKEPTGASLVLKSVSVQSWGPLAVSLFSLPCKDGAHRRGGKHLWDTEMSALTYSGEDWLQELDFSIFWSALVTCFVKIMTAGTWVLTRA